MPPGSVSVARPGHWGNPFVVASCARPAGQAGDAQAVATAAEAVARFRELVLLPQSAAWLAKARSTLRGKDLGCWCGLDQPCHADVWLELVNDAQMPDVVGE